MPTVRVNDITMYYEIHGQGEPVVLIAGLNSDIPCIGELFPDSRKAIRSSRSITVAWDRPTSRISPTPSK